MKERLQHFNDPYSCYLRAAVGICLLGAILATACAERPRTQYGVAIPIDVPQEQLAAVLGNPQAFRARRLVLTGAITGVCAAGCDFVLQDGTASSPVYPVDFKVPKRLAGTRVRLYAEVEPGKERPVISVYGMEVLPPQR